MNDRILNYFVRCLPGTLLLALATTGLEAQCDGPFELFCRAETEVILDQDCQREITATLVLTGLPACLADSNFVVRIADDLPQNDSIADGTGRFAYTLSGRDHAHLTGLSCTGHVRLTDATPPVITLSATVVDRRCNLRDDADINELPQAVARCWRVNGEQGTVMPGTLEAPLASALTFGGGIPSVADACGGEVEVCVNDVFDFPILSACVDTFTLQRSFTARALDGGDFAPTFRRQTVRFVRPRLGQLIGVEEAVYNRCNFGPVLSVARPLTAHYPYFNTLGGPIHLRQDLCELRVDYFDGGTTWGCNGGYSFVRTYSVSDICAGNSERLFSQIVRVGDHRGPAITVPTQDLDFDGLPDVGPLRFTTNTGRCSAVLDLRAGVDATDACSSVITLEALLFPNGDLTATPLGPFQIIGENPNFLSNPIPAGDHLLRYVALDLCGNESIADVGLVVTDGQPPLVGCATTFPVTLNGAGLATLPAVALDQNSTDGCGPVSFTVARVDSDGLPTEAPVSQITLRCHDAGTTPVSLTVSDANGNSNNCLVELIVTDPVPPTCFPPAPVTLDCGALAGQFPADLVAAFNDDPTATALELELKLDAVFGSATGDDNCSATLVTQSLGGGLDECGAGQFVRSFTVTDPGGLTQQGACRQVITVVARHEYTLRFPGDRNYECGDLPESGDIAGTATGCDLLAVNTSRDTLANTTFGSCLTLRLTHEVINWCEYDGQGSPLTVPRDADGDGNPGQAVFVHVVGGNPAGTSDDRAVIDQDAAAGSGNELGELIPSYGTSTRRGHFVYEQYIGVVDDTEPQLTVDVPEPGLAFTADCLGGVNVVVTATDDCEFTATTVSIDEFVTDLNGDGAFNAADFEVSYDVPETRFGGNPETGVNVAVRNLPIGRHLARVVTTDGCGNSTTAYTLLRVDDGRAPQPICVGVSGVELSPDATAGGTGLIYATDVLAGPAPTCTPTTVRYSLYTEEEAGTPGFLAQPGRSSIALDCADVGDMIVRLYAFADNTGRSSFCNAALVVTDADDLCADRMGRIDGLILDANGEPVRRAEVFNVGPTTATELTAGDGVFGFDGLMENVDYVVRPYLDSNPLNGLSTGDLNAIDRLLGGVDDGLTPYQLIAADANNNGNITIHDLLMIREVILGVEDGFDNNTSWRFVDANYTFPDPTDPWLETFPETVSVVNLNGSFFADFVAVKTGDVTLSASPQNTFTGVSNLPTGARPNGVRMRWRPGRLAGEWLLYAPQYEGGANAGAQFGLRAMQAEFRLPPGTKVLPGHLTPAEYHVNEKGLLRLSHVATAKTINNAVPLLRFIVSGHDLPELQTSVTALRPEAYTVDLRTLPLGLEVDLQPATPAAAGRESSVTASPNPFGGSTVLTAGWPVAEPVVLTVYDAAGRIVLQVGKQAVAGVNRWELPADGFGEVSGVFVVRLEGKGGVVEMVRVVRL